MARGQAERLLPLLEEVLAEGDTTWNQLDAIAVGTGPGNFTGIRISVAAARGLSLSLGIPALGFSLFDVRSFGYFDHPESDDSCLVCLPAPKDQIYLQRRNRNSDPDAAKLVAPASSALDPKDRDVVAIGPACEQLKGHSRVDGRWNSVARSTARMTALAEEHLRAGLPVSSPTPLYIRAADAAPPSDPPPVILP